MDRCTQIVTTLLLCVRHRHHLQHRALKKCVIDHSLSETETYNNGAHCGQTIAITDTKTGKTINGVVADECPTCTSADDIDLSVGLFTEFASEDVGVIPGVFHARDSLVESFG